MDPSATSDYHPGVIGRTISHYKILERCGAGGMGTVYRAEDTLLGRPVALKVPHPELLREPGTRTRFLTEARAASALDHPNIVVLYDIYDDGNDAFLAMQYVEGSSLRERLRSGPLPAQETVAIGRAIADALAHAHGRGVIHRDVKPENVLVAADGRVKVLDFGVARILADADATRTAGLVGTSRYLAPEIIGGAAADARSDLFSLGVLMHELCSGAPPFDAEHPAALLERIARSAPAPLPVSLPEPLRRLIGSLLEKEPGRRPGSAIEVADALYSSARGGDAPAAAATGGTLDRSIAILPLENLTGSAEEDHFCSGITEDLLTEVLKIPDLKVASRSMVDAVRSAHADPRAAGRSLGVATVLEGGVRRSGARVRVTARLVRADDGFPIWSERYDRGVEDVFEVQEDIARRIAEALRVTLGGGDTGIARKTKSPRAYDLRLRALALYNRVEEAETREAIRLLEEALREDPDYAVARADLAECCIQMVCKAWDRDRSWLDRGEAEARRACELAPALPDGYRSLGHLWNHRGSLERALRDYHYAVELDPRHALALMQLGNTYLMLGDVNRAEIYSRRAKDLEPESPRYQLVLADALRRRGQFRECRAMVRAALALRPSIFLALMAFDELLLCAAEEGDPAAIASVADEIRERAGELDPHPRALLAFAAAVLGRREEAARLLEGDWIGACSQSRAMVFVARARAILGQREEAAAAIERAFALGHLDLDNVRRDQWLRLPEELVRRLGSGPPTA